MFDLSDFSGYNITSTNIIDSTYLYQQFHTIQYDNYKKTIEYYVRERCKSFEIRPDGNIVTIKLNNESALIEEYENSWLDKN